MEELFAVLLVLVVVVFVVLNGILKVFAEELLACPYDAHIANALILYLGTNRRTFW